MNRKGILQLAALLANPTALLIVAAVAIIGTLILLGTTLIFATKIIGIVLSIGGLVAFISGRDWRMSGIFLMLGVVMVIQPAFIFDNLSIIPQDRNGGYYVTVTEPAIIFASEDQFTPFVQVVWSQGSWYKAFKPYEVRHYMDGTDLGVLSADAKCNILDKFRTQSLLSEEKTIDISGLEVGQHQYCVRAYSSVNTCDCATSSCVLQVDNAWRVCTDKTVCGQLESEDCARFIIDEPDDVAVPSLLDRIKDWFRRLFSR